MNLTGPLRCRCTHLRSSWRPNPHPARFATCPKPCPNKRYEAIAQELETAALGVPPPPPGMSGDAAAYFPTVFDLIGACADPFYHLFVSSPSPELCREALRWLNLIGNRHMICKTEAVPLKESKRSVRAFPNAASLSGR
jgi:hypothetical protein